MTIRTLAKRVARVAVDRGIAGLRPLDVHVCVCGMPRSGSTLLGVMINTCVRGVLTFDEEVAALDAARDAHRNHAFMATKRPADVHHLDAVRDYYAKDSGSGRPVFVLTDRDPRDVLTSVHRGYPPERGYYVELERWWAVAQALQRRADDPDVVLVRYETLVTDPASVQRQLTAAVGWDVTRPFATFHEAADPHVAKLDPLSKGALGGVRPPDASNIGRWRDPVHHARLRAVLDACPQLPEYLVHAGYEPDDAWIARLGAHA